MVSNLRFSPFITAGSSTNHQTFAYVPCIWYVFVIQVSYNSLRRIPDICGLCKSTLLSSKTKVYISPISITKIIYMYLTYNCSIFENIQLYFKSYSEMVRWTCLITFQDRHIFYQIRHINKQCYHTWSSESELGRPKLTPWISCDFLQGKTIGPWDFRIKKYSINMLIQLIFIFWCQCC